MTVYTVHTRHGSGTPKLFEANVEKETRTLYLIDCGTDHDACRAFGYRHRIPKEAAQLTPQAAWENYVHLQRMAKQRAETALSVERERLVLAEREVSKFEQPA